MHLSESFIDRLKRNSVIGDDVVQNANIESVHGADNQQNDVLANSCLLDEVVGELETHIQALARAHLCELRSDILIDCAHARSHTCQERRRQFMHELHIFCVVRVEARFTDSLTDQNALDCRQTAHEVAT